MVQKLTQMIGKNVKLYDMVLQFLRTLFLRTRNVHYCTLRAELLMSLHDLDISEICTVDPCHKVRARGTPCHRRRGRRPAWVKEHALPYPDEVSVTAPPPVQGVRASCKNGVRRKCCALPLVSCHF